MVEEKRYEKNSEIDSEEIYLVSTMGKQRRKAFC